MPDSWVLYIDESGQDDDPDDLHLAAGLLLRANDSVGLDALLRGILQETWPLWPWPPHAADLNRPASRVAAVLRSPPSADESARAAWLRACAQPLVDLALTSPHPAAVAFREALDGWSGGKLDFHVLRAADQLMSRHRPDAYKDLKEECEEQELRLQEYLSSMGRVDGARATVLLAISPPGEPDVPAAGLPTTRRGVFRDRYVRSLEILLALVHQLLAGARDEVRLYIATRGVRRRLVSGDVRYSQLFPHIVDDIEAAAYSGTPQPPRAPNLTPLGTPNRYDTSVVPGIVLADWIANRSRQALRRGRRLAPLSALVSHGALGQPASPLPVVLAPTRGGAALPSVGVDGDPWRAVRDSLAGRSATLEGVRPEWVRGVTAAWVEAATRWRHDAR